MSEVIYGPVEKWEASDNQLEMFERLANSTDELDNAYAQAYRSRCFVKEFGGIIPEKSIAVVGELDRLLVANFRLGLELDPSTLTMADCFELGAWPGSGETRAEKVWDGLRRVLEERQERRARLYS